jgi:anti-sigma-K factor RskA
MLCIYSYLSLVIYADDADVLGGNALAIRKNREALVVVSKEIGLAANAEKTIWARIQHKMQDEMRTYRQAINRLKLWNSLNIWKQP